MTELVTQARAETVLRTIAIAGPVVGLIVGILAGLRRRRVVGGAAAGLAAGLIGTALFGLWRVYLGFGTRYGYTSVASLAVQLVLFAGLGVAAGAVHAALTKKTRKERN